ncbi:MAG: RNA polymerase sigma factor, partial [Clostridia bacterium]
NPADIVVNQENIQYIYLQIKSLKKIYSDVLLLHLKFHFTPEMISDTLHINIKTVYTRLNRGTKLLRKKLEEKGVVR